MSPGALVRCTKECISLWIRDQLSDGSTAFWCDIASPWSYGETAIATGQIHNDRVEVIVPDVGRRWVRSHECEVVK